MRHLLPFLLLTAAFGQTTTITDTIRTPFGGLFSGTVTVTLNGPGQAQPLYSGNVTLSGWSQTVNVAAGAFTLTLYANDQITPNGTSYTATYAPASGTGWKETWVVATGATTIRAVRATTVPVPAVKFGLAQLDRGGANVGQGLVWGGSSWGPSSLLVDPTTTSGDLIYRGPSSLLRLGVGSPGQVLTVSGGAPAWTTLTNITGNAGTATALAANGTNCAAGSFPLGVDASGNAESCTAAVTASTGLSDSADIVRGASTLTTPGSVPFVTAAGVLGSSSNLTYTVGSSLLLNVSSGNQGVAVVNSGSGATEYIARNSTFGANAAAFGLNSTGAYAFGGSTIPLLLFSGGSERARFAATTGNLLLGTTTDDGTNRLQVAGGISIGSTPADVAISVQNGKAIRTGSAGTLFYVDFGTIAFRNGNAVEVGGGSRFFGGTTGNWALGTTTDGSFRLEVGSSGSSGTARIYDQTPTTGSTSLVVRAGAGQTGNLTAWQSSAAATIAAVGSTGRVFAPRFTTLVDSGWALQDDFNANFPLLLASNRSIGFSSTSSFAGTLDLSLSRASANTLQVGDGSANSNGTVLARIHTWANGTEGTCDATLRGQVVMVQGGAGVADRLRLCRKDATDTYLWAPVDNNVALQVVSSGPTATVTNQVRRVYVDPSTVIASLTLTLPAAPLDADQVQVYFGGTIANQAAVVTTLTISPNSGQAISQYSAPVNAFGGDMVTYEYRAAAARWYRIQ